MEMDHYLRRSSVRLLQSSRLFRIHSKCVFSASSSYIAVPFILSLLSVSVCYVLGCVILISLPFCFMNATYYCYALQIVHKSSFIIILLLLNRRALSNLTWHSPMMPKKAPLHYNYGHARYIFRYPHASHISSTLLLACHPPPVLLPSLLFRLLSPPLSFFLPTTYPTHRPPIPAHPLGLHNNRSASTSKAPRHVPTLFFPPSIYLPRKRRVICLSCLV